MNEEGRTRELYGVRCSRDDWASESERKGRKWAGGQTEPIWEGDAQRDRVRARASTEVRGSCSKDSRGMRQARQEREGTIKRSWSTSYNSSNYETGVRSPVAVYDPSLAKKTLGRAERTLYERLKDSHEEMPLRNEDLNEEAFMSPKGALDEYLFENVPDATMQLGQERHRREVCNSKLQEIERELQEFSEIFGSKLVELKKSMGEFAQSMKELMHYDEGNYIEDRLWEEADTNSKAVDTVTSSQSPPYR